MKKKKNMEAVLVEDYRKAVQYDSVDTDELSKHYRKIIEILGENPRREGLSKTPLRVARAMQFLTHGYFFNPGDILKSAMYKADYSEMVVVKDIEVYSICEHHMLPFFGRAHVAYIPNGYIVGLSKIARVVDAFARRFQVQEKMTYDILNCIQDTLNPKGVAVVVEAQHLCMMMRGIQKQNSVTTTSAFKGQLFKAETRAEFISLISAKLMNR